MLHLFVKGYEESKDFGMFAHIESEIEAEEMIKDFDPPLAEDEWYTRPCPDDCQYSD